MAIVKTFRTALMNAAVIEDPIPGSTNIFFQLDGYNKTSLAPQFDVQVNFGSTGALRIGYNTTDGEDMIDGTNQLGFPTLSGGVHTGGVFNWATGVLILNGETTHCRHSVFNTTNVFRNNIDPTPFLSMDPARRPRAASYWTDGVSNVSFWVCHLNTGSGGPGTGSMADSRNSDTIYALRVNSTSADLVNSNFVTTRSRGSNSGVGAISVQGTEYAYPMYRNPSTGNLIWFGILGQHINGSTRYYPSSGVGHHRGGAFTTQGRGAITSPSSGLVTNSTGQFVGVSLLDGQVISFSNSVGDDITQRFYKYNDSANTFSTLNTFTASPGASGSSVGGNRTTNFGSYKSKFASRWFTDPLTANSRGFYVPYVDTSGNYAPFYFQWNTQTDSFTRNANATINWGGGNTQATFWAHDTTLNAGLNVDYGMQSVWANETFTVGSNRYLIWMQLNGAGGLLDQLPRACTFITFSVNGADPRSLTYHSRIQVPATPKNIVWLDDSFTTIGVFTHNNFYIYSFNEANGWNLTASLPFQFSAVGRDNLGRIWAVDPGPLGFGRVHLITLTVPVTIVVTPDATAYTYSGTNINANVAVRALDANGNRISTNVKLVIDGGSMLFGGSNFTTTVTTSASADINVPIVISGGGVSNIIASVPV